MLLGFVDLYLLARKDAVDEDVELLKRDDNLGGCRDYEVLL